MTQTQTKDVYAIRIQVRVYAANGERTSNFLLLSLHIDKTLKTHNGKENHWAIYLTQLKKIIVNYWGDLFHKNPGLVETIIKKKLFTPQPVS